MISGRRHRAKGLMVLGGAIVMAVALATVLWNMRQLGAQNAVDPSLGWLHILFGVLGMAAGGFLVASAWMWRRIVMAPWRYRYAVVAATANASVLALLTAWGPPTSGTALATFPLLAGTTFGMLFDDEPGEDQLSRADPETLHRNTRRLARWWGILAAVTALVGVVEGLLRTPADTGITFPMAAMLLTIALLSRGDSRNPRFQTGLSHPDQERTR